MPATHLSSKTLVVVIPVFRDWTSAQQLLCDLNRELETLECETTVLLVNDSVEPAEMPSEVLQKLDHISAVHVLWLTRNLGHQRAICIGLAYVHKHLEREFVMVMDADGEDRPRDAVRLLQSAISQEGTCATFAARTKRSESVGFRLGYKVYRILHRILTGIPVKVGNFSILPGKFLDALMTSPETWNHYAASIFKLRLPIALIPTERGRRYTGKSSMNLTTLAIHGLSGISVFAENVSVRMLLAASMLLSLSLVSLGGVLSVKFFTSIPLPGWATSTFLLLLVVTLQLLSISGLATLLVTFQRSNFGFIPLRDFSLFVKDCVCVRPLNAKP